MPIIYRLDSKVDAKKTPQMSILYPAQRDFQPFLVYTASMCVFHNDFLEKPSIGSNQIISILGPTSVCDLGQKLHSILFGSHPWIYPSSNKHSEYFRPFLSLRTHVKTS